jgi:hypothetical protein
MEEGHLSRKMKMKKHTTYNITVGKPEWKKLLERLRLLAH